jgi:hypothetical protein
VRFNHVASWIINANHGIMPAAGEWAGRNPPRPEQMKGDAPEIPHPEENDAPQPTRSHCESELSFEDYLAMGHHRTETGARNFIEGRR